MKLQDLIEARVVDTVHGIPVISHADDSVIDFTKMQHIGSGVEGDAYITKSGKSVIKAVRLTFKQRLEDNTYLAFIGVCLANQNNPFFPKIHSAKIYNLNKHQIKHKDGTNANPMARARRRQRQGLSNQSDYVLVVSMEPLVSIKSQPPKLMDKLFNRMGITLSDYRNSAQVVKDEKKGLVHLADVGDDPDATDKLQQQSNHVAFNRAIDILKPLFDAHGGDLHIDNWMLRKTGSGMQIVLLDPIKPMLERVV